MRTLGAALAVVMLLSGCHHPGSSSTRVHETVLLDATGSIKPEALAQALDAIERDAAAMHHGDCLTVLPIVGSSDSVPANLVIRKCVPQERQPYDQEMTDFRSEVHRALGELRTHLSQYRATKTDILGAIHVAEQEFALNPAGARKVLTIYSDFIEEDENRNFRTSPDLTSPEAAEKLAHSLASISSTGCAKPIFNWAGVSVYLGNIESYELPKLPPVRREAIHRFWIAYFTALNARPFFASDGPGMSANFLSQMR